MENPPRGNGSARLTVGGDEQDTLFEALSRSYRRFVLRYLAETGGSPPVSGMATALAARQADLPAADRSATGVDTIGSALHHHRLPKLDATNTVEYDSTRGDSHARDASPGDDSTSGPDRGAVVPLEHDRTTQ